MTVRREISWENAIKKAHRLEKTLATACSKASAIPIIKLIQMVKQTFDSAILYGLGTVRKRHATNLKELDAIQARVLKQASGLNN